MNRNYSLDTLRSIAVLLVILLHVSGPYVSNSIAEGNYDYNFWFANMADSFSRVCVPLFVLISGRFLLGGTENFKTFYSKRASRILLPFFAWSLIYLIYRGVMDTDLGENKLQSLFINVVLGRPFYHLWYLYMLLGLYFITPVLNIVIEYISKKNLFYVAIFFMLIGFIINLYDFYLNNTTFFLLWFVNYLGYFLFGYLMKDMKKISNLLLISIYLLSGIMITILSYFTGATFGNLYFYAYLSPFVIIGSLSFYKFFCQVSLKNNFLSAIAPFSFGIYLIHAAILHALNRILANSEQKIILENALYGIPVIFALVASIALATAFGISRIKHLKRII